MWQIFIKSGMIEDKLTSGSYPWMLGTALELFLVVIKT